MSLSKPSLHFFGWRALAILLLCCFPFRPLLNPLSRHGVRHSMLQFSDEPYTNNHVIIRLQRRLRKAGRPAWRQ